MSITTKAGAAVIALTSLFTTNASAEENNCTPENVSASVNLNYLQESLNGGKAQFNPLREAVTRIDCGDKWSLNLHGDIKTNDAFDFDGMRIEKASLTYRPTDDVSIEVGKIGESRHFRGQLKAGSAGRANLTHGDTGQLRYLNHVETGVGMSASYSPKLGESWKGKFDGTILRALKQKPRANFTDDRANSTKLSHFWNAEFSDTKGKIRPYFGIQAGQVQNGLQGNAVETYVAPYAGAKADLRDNLTASAVGQLGFFKNSQNQKGNDESAASIYADLQWKPEKLDGVTAWIGSGATFDENINDAWHGEAGLRKDFAIGNGRLSLYGSGGWKEDISGDDKQGKPAWQIGARFFKQFDL